MTGQPQLVIEGLTFWPIPKFSDIHMAFGAEINSYFDRYRLPEVPKKYRDQASKIFFEGGKIEVGDDVNKDDANRAIRAVLCSFAPAHEAKEATVAYALWCWSPETRHLREGGAA